MDTFSKVRAALAGGDRGLAAFGAFLFIAAVMLLAVFA